jgi:acyl carrier protein
MSDSTKDHIRQVLRDHARLPVDVDSLDDGDDLFQAGMSSHASVSLMLALEDTFDVEFPDQMLTRQVFSSVSEMAAAVDMLRAGVA